MSLTCHDVVAHREDGDGAICGAHLPGHIDSEIAVAVFWAWHLEYGGLAVIRRGFPKHRYLRKVPRESWILYQLTPYPGRGATPITYIEPPGNFDDVACHYHPRCMDQAVTGIPVEMFTDAPEGIDYVYYCKAHYGDYLDRYREALREITIGGACR